MQNIIVSFDEISKAIDLTYESATNPIRESIQKAEPDPQKALSIEREFKQGLRKLAEARTEVDAKIFHTPDNRMGSLFQTFLAERAAESGNLEEAVYGGYEAKFGHDDFLGWAFSLFDWIRGIKDHEMLRPANTQPGALPNIARIAVLGDWGTDLYGAPVIAETIEKDSRDFTMLLHLGDVYYSGTEKEVQSRFLRGWPNRSEAINRALNSNHEMYSGGYGYFKLTLPQFEQSSSYFAFQNDYWTLIGLDTGYKDHNLDDEQVKWITKVVEQAENRKVILSSHHQPFSLLEDPPESLLEKLKPLLDSQRIFAWYWGHEHRCVVHDKHPSFGLYGRCIGHSGMPYGRGHLSKIPIVEKKGRHLIWRQAEAKNGKPGAMFLDGPNPYLGDKRDKYGPNGYLTLEFVDEHLNETYHLADGTPVLTVQIA